MEWPNEAVLEFLQLYKQEAVIWNPVHPLHRDRHEVLDAWRRIRDALNLQFTVNELKRKKDSLMATYRTLYNRVKLSVKVTADHPDVYKPNWFAYSVMDNFLSAVYQPRVQLNTENLTTELENMSYEECEITDKDEISGKEEVSIYAENSQNNLSEETGNFTQSSSKQKEKKNTSEGRSIEKRISEAYNIVRAVRQKHKKDDCDLYGELLARKLKRLDQRTRDIVMNDIDNIVFRAVMNKTTHVRESAIPSRQCMYPTQTSNDRRAAYWPNVFRPDLAASKTLYVSFPVASPNNSTCFHSSSEPSLQSP